MSQFHPSAGLRRMSRVPGRGGPHAAVAGGRRRSTGQEAGSVGRRSGGREQSTPGDRDPVGAEYSIGCLTCTLWDSTSRDSTGGMRLPALAACTMLVVQWLWWSGHSVLDAPARPGDVHPFQQFPVGRQGHRGPKQLVGYGFLAVNWRRERGIQRYLTGSSAVLGPARRSMNPPLAWGARRP